MTSQREDFQNCVFWYTRSEKWSKQEKSGTDFFSFLGGVQLDAVEPYCSKKVGKVA